ncbi:MAG: radical SAM protein [Spirochaetaceae bacterium]
MIVEKILKDIDNTGKISIRLDDGAVIESVLLVDQTNRVTACISSQVGCAQGCLFCKTGALGLGRNLSVSEITGQLQLLQNSFNREVTNIVYMGMGEPLHNTQNVVKSIRVFTDPKGSNIFLRRITVSTSGVIKGITELVEKAPYPGLAFSLITANQELRSRIMPGSPSLDIIKLCLLEYQRISRKRIIIEVINFKGINTTLDEAIAIKNFLTDLDVIINLIPFNSIGESEFEAPELNDVKGFSQFIHNLDLKVTIRHGKGQSIAGACGQLGEI